MSYYWWLFGVPLPMGNIINVQTKSPKFLAEERACMPGLDSLVGNADAGNVFRSHCATY